MKKPHWNTSRRFQSTDIRRAALKTIPLMMVLSTLLAFACQAAWAGENDVAEVTEFNGKVTIKRGFKSIPVAKGTRLQNGDVLKTDADSAIGILFSDETTLSLGPGTKLTIQDYVFAPERSSFSFVVRLAKGTASYVSGLIAKLSPDSARFITPSASIGVRGTKFVIEVDAL